MARLTSYRRSTRGVLSPHNVPPMGELAYALTRVGQQIRMIFTPPIVINGLPQYLFFNGAPAPVTLWINDHTLAFTLPGPLDEDGDLQFGEQEPNIRSRAGGYPDTACHTVPRDPTIIESASAYMDGSNWGVRWTLSRRIVGVPYNAEPLQVQIGENWQTPFQFDMGGDRILNALYGDDELSGLSWRILTLPDGLIVLGGFKVPQFGTVGY